MGNFKTEIRDVLFQLCTEKTKIIKCKRRIACKLGDVDLSLPGNPLDNHPTWKYTRCPETGMKAIRETDTLDTFVDSVVFFKILFTKQL